jgi:prepilin-type N-terminal cleavage/methylation domain-containing protein
MFGNMHSSVTNRVQKNYSPRAFTLIELLVVIAIIGILSAMLLPVLSRSKTRAVSMTDINNLKQMITATHVYTSDNVDTLPWPNWMKGDSPKRAGWLYTLNTSATGPARFNVQTGLLWESLRNAQIYICPMDVPGTRFFNQRQQQISSYAMNGAVIGYNRIKYPAVKLSSLRADDIAFWETDEKNPRYFNDGANYPREGVSTRHLNGAINAAFGGSVSYIRIDFWYLQVDDARKNSLWCYPNSADGR